ncbi:MAG: ISL3 family transposase, partial [Dehalococcoidia bacterium]
MTVVVDHATGDVIWTGEGKDTAALDAFFAELGPQRAARLQAISLDMGKAYPASAAKDGHAPQAVICWDPFHVVKVGTEALNAVRREHWNQLRASAAPEVARRFKGARWALLRNPEDLNDRQADALAAIRRTGGAVWRAYKGKEALRAIFAGDLPEPEVAVLLDRWCAWAQRSRLPAFVKAGRTIRAHRDGILAAIRLGLSNGRVEGRIRHHPSHHPPRLRLSLTPRRDRPRDAQPRRPLPTTSRPVNQPTEPAVGSYFAWYSLNLLALPPHVIAEQLG